MREGDTGEGDGVEVREQREEEMIKSGRGEPGWSVSWRGVEGGER